MPRRKKKKKCRREIDEMVKLDLLRVILFYSWTGAASHTHANEKIDALNDIIYSSARPHFWHACMYFINHKSTHVISFFIQIEKTQERKMCRKWTMCLDRKSLKRCRCPYSLFKYLCAFECVSIQAKTCLCNEQLSNEPICIRVFVRIIYVHICSVAPSSKTEARARVSALRTAQSFFIITAIFIGFFFISTFQMLRLHFNRIENIFKFYVDRRFVSFE